MPFASRNGGDGSSSQPPLLDRMTSSPPLACSAGAKQPGGMTGSASGSTLPPGGGPDGRSADVQPTHQAKSRSATLVLVLLASDAIIRPRQSASVALRACGLLLPRAPAVLHGCTRHSACTGRQADVRGYV